MAEQIAEKIIDNDESEVKKLIELPVEMISKIINYLDWPTLLNLILSHDSFLRYLHLKEKVPFAITRENVETFYEETPKGLNYKRAIRKVAPYIKYVVFYRPVHYDPYEILEPFTNIETLIINYASPAVRISNPEKLKTLVINSDIRMANNLPEIIFRTPNLENLTIRNTTINANELQQMSTYPIKRLKFNYATFPYAFPINLAAAIFNSFQQLEEVEILSSIGIQEGFFHQNNEPKHLKLLKCHTHPFDIDYEDIAKHHVQTFVIFFEPLNSVMESNDLLNILKAVCKPEHINTKIIVDRIDIWATSEEAITRFHNIVQYVKEKFAMYDIEFPKWPDSRIFPGFKTRKQN